MPNIKNVVQCVQVVFKDVPQPSALSHQPSAISHQTSSLRPQTSDLSHQNGPCPMQLVVPIAVSAAVRIDTITCITVFQVSFFIALKFHEFKNPQFLLFYFFTLLLFYFFTLLLFYFFTLLLFYLVKRDCPQGQTLFAAHSASSPGVLPPSPPLPPVSGSSTVPSSSLVTRFTSLPSRS